MFKEYKVVMLPATEKAKVGEYAIMENSAYGIDTYLSCGILTSLEGYNMKCIEQHLYITSNDKIQEGDYIIDCNGVFGPYETGDILFGKFNPIIASTDPSLNLPSPSKEFIKAYCNKGGIDTVMVEYYKESLKVIDNTIITKSVKESWTKEEVLNLLESFATKVDNQYSPSPEYHTTAQEILSNFKL